ncbi:hypothetical protein [Nocardia salmonicida]|uniref:hypothetical protein n=1 Tax=Nocardia salmonicida TaxID=53431 RepID=UPI003401AA9D
MVVQADGLQPRIRSNASATNANQIWFTVKDLNDRLLAPVWTLAATPVSGKKHVPGRWFLGQFRRERQRGRTEHDDGHPGPLRLPFGEGTQTLPRKVWNQ